MTFRERRLAATGGELADRRSKAEVVARRSDERWDGLTVRQDGRMESRPFDHAQALHRGGGEAVPAGVNVMGRDVPSFRRPHPRKRMIQ